MTLPINVEISSLLKPLAESYTRISNEWDNFFQLGLSDYLYTQTDKYYFTYTFIHREKRVKFFDIYFPVSVHYDQLTSDFSEVSELFDNYKNICIIGSAGSGKSTLIKHIFLKSIALKQKIPVLIELRYLNEFDGDLETLITEKVLKSRLKPSDATFKRALESGSFIFLLDGYDEIFSDNKQKINRQIELFVDSYFNNNFLITTRPGSGIENFPSFYDFEVLPLRDEEVIGFINKIVSDTEKRNRIEQIVGDAKNSNYREYLRNPLLLSMFIIAFEKHPEIPQRKSSFYRNVFDTLYSIHDGISKSSWPREKLTKLQREDFQHILSIFSYLTLMQGYYTFSNEILSDTLKKVKSLTDYKFNTDFLITDLRTAISILILDGLEYSFPHRSMQEYFAAIFIKELPTNKKDKAYQNLAHALEISSTDHSYNFWNLCYELDEDNFIQHFILPQLNSMNNEFENKNDSEIIEPFLEIIDPNIYFSETESGVNIKLHRHINYRNAILDFCDINYYILISQFPMVTNCESNLEEIFYEHFEKDKLKGSRYFAPFLEIESDPRILKILIDHGFESVVKQTINKIRDKIASLEKKMADKKSRIDFLLG